MKTDEQLRQENPELYKVARENGTEYPHSGKYLNEKRDGTYHCAVCDAPLFSSKTKFDSKSGWPAFTDPVDRQGVELVEDYSHGMNRTEVRCKNCDAHLGHVWLKGAFGMKDDNGKTCDYYCINSVSLDLKENKEHD